MKKRRLKPSGRVSVQGRWTMPKLPGRRLAMQLLMAVLWSVTSLEAESLLLTGAMVHTVSGETLARDRYCWKTGRLLPWVVPFLRRVQRQSCSTVCICTLA